MADSEEHSAAKFQDPKDKLAQAKNHTALALRQEAATIRKWGQA